MVESKSFNVEHDVVDRLLATIRHYYSSEKVRVLHIVLCTVSYMLLHTALADTC